MEQIKCPVCQKREAIQSKVYGILPCQSCKDRRFLNKLPNNQVEFTIDRVRNERKEFAKDIIQPYRAGEPSKEFIEHYPNKAKEMFTPKEIKKAKNVWKGI